MPDPPAVSLFTRYVLENPYPVGIVLLALGAWLAWGGMQAKHGPRLAAGGVLAAAGAAVLITGALVVTSGEHARRVVSAVVDAAVAGDVAGAGAHFAPDAAIALGSPSNPGYPRAQIERSLDQLDGRYRIASNRVTRLRSYTETRRRATVHLACLTTLEVGFGPTVTSWVLQVEQQPDGSWAITRVTWVSLAGQTPSSPLGH